MKIVAALTFSLFIVSCGGESKASLAQIEGSSSYENEWLYLVEPDVWRLQAKILDSVKTTETGDFTFKTDVKDFGEYLISGRGFFLASVFLHEESALELKVKGKGRSRKIEFGGEGSEINKFWQNFSAKFLQNGGFNRDYQQLIKENEPDQFAKKWENYVSQQKEKLDSFVKKADPNEGFVEYANSFIKYNRLSKRLTYLFHKPKVKRMGVSYIQAPESYYSFLEDVDLTEKPKYVHSAYNDFMYAYMVDKRMRRVDGSSMSAEETFRMAEESFDGEVRDIAAAHVLKDMMQMASGKEDYETLKKLIAEFKSWPAGEKYISFIDEKYREKAELAPGSPAPDFTLQNIKGETVSLSSFKGKGVVIDFWGTWCGPCKRELPYSKKIEKHFEERDDIVFLFVALERGPKATWKNFVEQQNLPGVHLYARNSDPSLRPYKITSVPRYVLVNKEGNIHDAFASRPSQNMQQQIANMLEI